MDFHYFKLNEIKNRKSNKINKNVKNKSLNNNNKTNIENIIIHNQRKFLYKKIDNIKNFPSKLNCKKLINKQFKIKKKKYNLNKIFEKKKQKLEKKKMDNLINNIKSEYNNDDLKLFYRKNKKIKINISKNSRRIQSNYTQKSKYSNFYLNTIK